MLSVNKLTISFGGKDLFSEISFLINKNDHIGLTGKNGAGKSTLLKVLAGRQTPTSGEVSRPGGYTIGYLPQEMQHTDGRTVMQETLTAFEALQKIEKEIHRLSDDIAATTDTSSDAFMDLLARHHDLTEKFAMQGGYEMEGNAEKILMGLGFTRADFDRNTENFSGGWRMRVELAKILLQQPDLVLLDEPTNHLDIESVQWLENFLSTYPGAIVLVSHDKVFLDAVTNRTIEIVVGRIEDYKCNYSKYLIQRAERRATLLAAKSNQDKQIADLERFVERFKAKASKAAQAQSKLKQLEKIDRIEIDDEETGAIRFRFPEPPRAGALVYLAEELTKNYGPKEVLRGIDFEVERHDKIAFVGRNGEGKSTLSKILAGAEPFTGGKLTAGHNVKIGYYAQNQADALNSDKTVFETIDDEARGEMRTKVRSLLGAFLFSGDAVDKKVKVLSGGEKARLALAKLLLEPVNLLVMDEPTNHLDMRSKDVLKDALMNYQGALVVVSHDRDFLQGLTDKVFEFKGGHIKQYFGDIYDYLQAVKAENIDTATNNVATGRAAAKQADKSTAPTPAAPAPGISREERRAAENKIKKLTQSHEKLEDEIAALEKEVARLEKELYAAAPPAGLLSEYEARRKALDAAMAQWEAMATEIGELNQQLKPN